MIWTRNDYHTLYNYTARSILYVSRMIFLNKYINLLFCQRKGSCFCYYKSCHSVKAVVNFPLRFNDFQAELNARGRVIFARE